MEYQSKSLLEKHNVAVQRFIVADKIGDASDLSNKLSKLNKIFKMSELCMCSKWFECSNHFLFQLEPGEYVVKAQILAGGRGLGVFDSGFKGGVHLTKE